MNPSNLFFKLCYIIIGILIAQFCYDKYTQAYAMLCLLSVSFIAGHLFKYIESKRQ